MVAFNSPKTLIDYIKKAWEL